MPSHRSCLLALVLCVLGAPALAFDPVPFEPPKVGLEIHFDMHDAATGKQVGHGIHRITGASGKEVTFTSNTEQTLSGRSFKFDNEIVSLYGLAPRRMSGGKSGTVAIADWKALDDFWPMVPDKTVYLSFDIFRAATSTDIGNAKPYMRGRSSFTALRAEKLDVLGQEHDTIVLERVTVDEILAAKTPIKREIRYRIWWSRRVHWMVRMEIAGGSGDKPQRQIVTVTKLVEP